MSRKTSGNGLGFKDRKDAHHYHFGDITKSLVSGVASGVSHILHHGHHEHTKEWSTADRMVFEALHAELRAPFNAEDVESTALLHSIWRHLLPDAGDLQLESPLWKSVGCVPLFQLMLSLFLLRCIRSYATDRTLLLRCNQCTILYRAPLGRALWKSVDCVSR